MFKFGLEVVFYDCDERSIMTKKESNAYVLGTDLAELHRLGIQHQVWASEAHRGWNSAGFTRGQVLLDLGCGPGFCSKELAYTAGVSGKVIAVDKSLNYINHLRHIAELEKLSIETICTDFENLVLERERLDGVYIRWALAWVASPKKLLEKLLLALKPGGHIVIHEYYDWGTHSTEPDFAALTAGIAAAYRSFKDQAGDIDIGRRIPQMLSVLGMKISSVRLMCKLARPTDFSWQWPASFYRIYFPKLVGMGFLSKQTCHAALLDLERLEQIEQATIFAPSMVEVIGVKA